MLVSGRVFFSKLQKVTKTMGKVNQPPPGPRTPPRNKGLIAGLIKGNQWLISPDHKALFLGGVRGPGGGWLTCHYKRGENGKALVEFWR